MRSLLPLLLLGACSETNLAVDDKTEGTYAPGAIRGRVCSADGRNWLADATVYTNIVDADNRLIETKIVYTDLDGNFELDELPGNEFYTVYVQYGGDILQQYDDVEVPEGDTVTLEEPDCFDPLEVDVAVVTGDYDDFELVLSNMGFANYEVIDGLDSSEITGFFLDSEAMSQYDIIFIDGGCIEAGVFYEGDAVSDNVVANLRSYVSDGGSIYASDWAYDAVEVAWPDSIDFVGNDDEPDAAQLGEYDEVTAAISDAAMAEWLGQDYLDIEYDLPVWPPIENTSSAVSIHLSGSIEYREGTQAYSLSSVPLLVSFNSGEGKVVYSTFRVAKNATTDMLLVLQYMMYNL